MNNGAKTAVLVGGGEGAAVTAEVVKLTGKTDPRILLFPTACRDGTGGSLLEQFRGYSRELEVVELCRRAYAPEELRAKILSADLIFVGGGETEFLMDTWKRLRVDGILCEAYEKGVVLAGTSAGAICWTVKGYNDFCRGGRVTYGFCEGIGLLPVYFGPHFDDAGFAGFDAAVRAMNDPAVTKGYALENGSALIFSGGICRAARESDGSHIYEYTYKGGVWTRAEFRYELRENKE